jgi:hypothetical protein
MAESATGDGLDEPGAIVTARPRPKTNLVTSMRRLAAEGGADFGAVLRDHVRTSFGPGRLSFDEFIALRLFDKARYADADPKRFVGARAMQRLWRRANFRPEFYDVIRNKIAMTAMLSAHGFPTIPIDAMFTAAAGFETAACLRSRETLTSYLLTRAPYPLFGKPMHGLQSLGSASILACDAESGRLTFRDGSVATVDKFVDDVATHYADGYFFQRHVSPHPDTMAICGDRLATARVVTLMSAEGPRIWRCCEKLPAGRNVADNYWREGNLLAPVDPATGRRGAATSGAGFGLRDHAHHPDSGLAIAGTQVPHWTAVRELAIEGARMFKGAPLIGWDIAPVEGGAVVVEANATPDFFLPQLASRRGALDDEFRAFLDQCDRDARKWKRDITRETMDLYTPSWK